MKDNPEKDKIDDGGTTLNMTLLDYFAGQIINGHYSDPTSADCGPNFDPEKWAYTRAQAMIAEKRRLEA